MKITDFGLWFKDWDTKEWSTIIPHNSGFSIYYDGERLGHQDNLFTFFIYNTYFNRYTIQVKCDFHKKYTYYQIGRFLTLDDFEIIGNPLNEDF